MIYSRLQFTKYIIFFLFLLAISTSHAEKQTYSIRLIKAPLVSTLQQLALEQQINLIVDDELTGTVSLQLENTDFDRLIHSIAKIKKLKIEQENGIYYLHTPNKEASEKNNPLGTEENLITTTIKLNFARAADIAKSLTTNNGSLLSTAGSMSFDERSNLLIIKDEPKIVRQIKKLIIDMDKPIEQISIEARIVTMSDESLKELGIRWGIFTPSDTTNKVSGKLDSNHFNDISNQLNINFPANNSNAASVALQVAKINGRLLDLELSALERENNVEIIASPKLLTTNQKSASIKQGTEIPYVINNSKNDTQSVEFREAVLGLEVTPHLSKDNNILLDLVVSQNSPSHTLNTGSSQFTTIDKQEINTQVFAKDGETIVLGGIFHDTMTKGVDKVPLLGDIPIIKHAFRFENEKHQKRELVIFVTPHIIKSPELKNK